VAWARVFAGVAVAVGGILWAQVILDFVLQASEGKLAVDTHLQAQLITWEICLLAMLTGSGIAGATRGNGLKQGLFVGIGSSVMLGGLGYFSGTTQVALLVLLAACALALGLAGGWFGSQLFPPVCTPARRRRTGPAAF
jgi:hypothetical protein